MRHRARHHADRRAADAHTAANAGAADRTASAAGRCGSRWTLPAGSSPNSSSYFGAATLTVDEQGTIEGSGYFSATLDGGACHALVLDEEPLTFQLSGKIDMPGAGTPIPTDSVWGEVRVIPDQRWQQEHFQVLCPDDLGGVREHSAPMLWNLLGAPNTSWPLGFRAGFRNTIEGVAPIPRSGNSATLSGEIVLNRR